MYCTLQTLRYNGVSLEEVKDACKQVLPYLTEAEAFQQEVREDQVRMHTIVNAAIFVVAGYCVTHSLS